MSNEGKLLFVYGTLKSGGRLNHHMIKVGAVLLCKSYYMEDSRLVNTGNGFPALTYSQGDYVKGELWAVPEEGLLILDKVEGVPFLFEREDLIFADMEGCMYSSKKWDHVESSELINEEGAYEWKL